MHPSIWVQYGPPDCIEVVAPSSTCSLDSLNCSGCTVEALHPNPRELHQLIQPPHACCLDRRGRDSGTLRTEEERSSACWREDPGSDRVGLSKTRTISTIFFYMQVWSCKYWAIKKISVQAFTGCFTFQLWRSGCHCRVFFCGTSCSSWCGRGSRTPRWAWPGSRRRSWCKQGPSCDQSLACSAGTPGMLRCMWIQIPQKVRTCGQRTTAVSSHPWSTKCSVCCFFGASWRCPLNDNSAFTSQINECAQKMSRHLSHWAANPPQL